MQFIWITGYLMLLILLYVGLYRVRKAEEERERYIRETLQHYKHWTERTGHDRTS